MDRVMDALLSLLSVPAAALPSAPLRDAVEGLFRSCATHLTSAGAHRAQHAQHAKRGTALPLGLPEFLDICAPCAPLSRVCWVWILISA